MISRTTRATRPPLAVTVPVSRIERRAWIRSLPPRAARFEATTSSTGDGEEHAARSAPRSGSTFNNAHGSLPVHCCPPGGQGAVRRELAGSLTGQYVGPTPSPRRSGRRSSGKRRAELLALVCLAGLALRVSRPGWPGSGPPSPCDPLLAGLPLREDRLPLARRHPLTLELHVALGAVALLLGDPFPVEQDPAERAVRFVVVRQDRDHLRVRLPAWLASVSPVAHRASSRHASASPAGMLAARPDTPGGVRTPFSMRTTLDIWAEMVPPPMSTVTESSVCSTISPVIRPPPRR